MVWLKSISGCGGNFCPDTLFERRFLWLFVVIDSTARPAIYFQHSWEGRFFVRSRNSPHRKKREFLSLFSTRTQGPQLTCGDFARCLLDEGIQVSMDGRGRVYDNIFVGRLWRSVKYEEVYLYDYQTVPAARAHLSDYFGFYNTERPHEALGYRTPHEVYFGTRSTLAQASSAMV